MRRIITGHNSDGKSVISIDGPPARSIGEEAGGLFEIWNTDEGGFDTKSKTKIPMSYSKLLSIKTAINKAGSVPLLTQA